MSSLGYNPNHNLVLKKDLIYKGLKYKWNLSRHEIPVERILVEMLSEEVGVQVKIMGTVNQLDALKTVIEKLVYKKTEVDKTYLKWVEEKGKFSESGLSVGTSLIPYLKRLIPLDLVGGDANRNKLLVSFRKSLKFGLADIIPLKFFMKGLKIKGVKWLKSFKNDTVKQNLFSKVVVWLWRVTKKLIASKYYVTEEQNTSYKLKFIPKKLWQSRIDAAFNLMVHHGKLKPLTPADATLMQSRRLPATLRWLPKTNGLRPVVYVKGDKFGQFTVLSKVFLKQLLKNTYTDVNPKILHKVWKSVIERNMSNSGSPLFFVTVDIHDAYGSIIQDKLISVVEEIVVRYLGDISTKILHYDSVTSNDNKKTFLYRELHNGPPQYITHTKEVKVVDLIQAITNIIKCQTVQRTNRSYLIEKGISQAVASSATLCNLYLGHLDETHLAQFRTDPDDSLLRAVDDYLYITPSRVRAQLFLETMTAGFEDYGLHINPKKTQSNLSHDQEINYFGFLFDSANFEVFVKYNQGVSCSFRNSLSLNNRLEPIALLYDKMKRIQTYKLTRLVLDRVYMSSGGVARNVFETACVMACSLKAIVDSLVTRPPDEALVELITYSAHRVAGRAIWLRDNEGPVGKKKQSKVAAVSAATSTNRLKGILKKELYWIVLRAFLLCLSHGTVREFKDFPESILPFLRHLEEEAQCAVRPFTIKLVSHIVNDLPSQFKTGH